MTENSIENMNHEQYQRQVDLAKMAMELCLNFSSYVYFADPPNDDESKVHANATCVFVDTGSEKFAITNYHVIEEYRCMKEYLPRLNFQIGSESVDILSRIIDESQYYDLVTFIVTPEEVQQFKKQYCVCRTWPPRRAIEGETIFLAGYPGELRIQKGIGHISFESVLITETITSSSPEKITLAMDETEWEKHYGKREISEITSFGGVSGSGIFRLTNGRSITSVEPIGIMFEGGKLEDRIFQLARHIDLINEKGIIQKGPY